MELRVVEREATLDLGCGVFPEEVGSGAQS